MRPVGLMRYNILTRLEKPNGQVRCEIDGAGPGGTGADLTGDVTGHVELTHTGGDDVVARGRVSGTADVECSRCVKAVPWRFDIEFVENCTLREIDDPEGYEMESDEEELVPILDDDVIDLTELVRQLIAVEVPYSPVCDPDCAGLCAACGADLNEADCGCPEKPIDPRWQKLKELL